MTKPEIHEASHQPLDNYLRAHRLRTRLTQHDVAQILGRESRAIVSHHERFESVPSLFVALSYQVLYRIPVSEIFSGLAEMVEIHIESELAEFEKHLGEQSARGRQAAATARKLEWLSERRSSGYK
jgi:DNA-binding XRE family transcriptional regulator